MTYAKYDSPLGKIFIAAKNRSLCGLWFEGQKYFPDLSAAEALENNNEPVLVTAKHWLDSYFIGDAPDASVLAVSPDGSDFQKEVWQLLCEIPYGKTVTYGYIAKCLAEKKGIPSISAQAVGGAVGHNPVSIIIPCHRVIGASGSLAGYAGGIEKKIALLKLEKAYDDKFFIPKKSTAP